MIPFKFENIASCKITVPNTASNLKTLIDTAGSAINNIPDFIDVINLIPEDGSIRILYQNTPTTTKGILIKQGSYYTVSGNIEDFNIISVSGNVATSLFLSQDK
jgi:hypothetical protein